MSDTWVVVIGAIIGSSAFTTVINHICNALERKYSKKDDLQTIKEQLHKQEKDSVRLQLLLMLSDYPGEVHEIMTLGECYFSKLQGNWYMTGLFNKWLEDNNIAKPEWFLKKGEE